MSDDDDPHYDGANNNVMSPPITGHLDEPTSADDLIAQSIRRDQTITQDGIARLFAERYAGRLLYDHTERAWFEFVGTHWRRDGKRRAFEFVRQIAREVTEGRDVKEKKEFRKTAFAGGVERFAQGDQSLAVTSEKWDADAFSLATPGGVVNLRTGILRPARPDDYATKLTAVAPAGSADCPRWRAFISEVTGGDEAVVRFLQQFFGYCLTGDVREHALIFGYGPGGNGKSVLLNTIVGILGDYALTTPAETFATSLSDRHPTELARLRGARLVAASETEHGRVWAESKVKAMTGGDRIAARKMRQDFFEFWPQFKIAIVGNYEPQLHHVDDALRRRFNIVRLDRRPAKPDPELEAKLRAEWPGILRWLIAGCIDWQRNGLTRPQSVVEATNDYFASQDVMAQWLDACCVVDRASDQLSATSKALYASWAAFAREAGIKHETQKAFGLELRKRGFRDGRGKLRTRGYLGIAIQCDACDAS